MHLSVSVFLSLISSLGLSSGQLVQISFTHVTFACLGLDTPLWQLDTFVGINNAIPCHGKIKIVPFHFNCENKIAC